MKKILLAVLVLVVVLIVGYFVGNKSDGISINDGTILSNFSAESKLTGFDLVLRDKDLIKEIIKTNSDTFNRQLPPNSKQTDLKGIHFILTNVEQSDGIVASPSGLQLQSASYRYDSKNSRLVIEVYMYQPLLLEEMQYNANLLDLVFGKYLCLGRDRTVSREEADKCNQGAENYFGNLEKPLFSLVKK